MKKSTQKKEERPSITELMQQWGKSREQVLEMLNLTSQKLVKEKSPAMDRNIIKQAKKDEKDNKIVSPMITEFFNNRIPQWGSIVFNKMRINAL